MEEYDDYDYDIDFYADEDQIEYSCYYCNNKNQASLIKCCNHGCEQYFCNNISEGQSESHIFTHLDIRSHNIISFQNDYEISCFKCGESNCFALCYQMENSEISIICRTKCLVDNLELRSLDWHSIFREKSIDTLLIESARSSKNITFEEIRQLEINLSHGEMKNPLDIGPESYHKISLKYKKYEHYKDTYERLIELEHEYDKYYSQLESSQTVIPEWDPLCKTFTYRLTEERCHFNIGDEVCISAPQFKSDGIIYGINNQGIVTVELAKKKIGLSSMTRVTVKPVYNDVAYERMKRGLKSFKNVSQEFKDTILGYNVKMNEFEDQELEDYSAPGLPKLNPSQNEAVKRSLISKISLIQGPPGTGKTVTTATIVYHLSKIINKPKQYEITRDKVNEYEKLVESTFNDIQLIDQELKLRSVLSERILESKTSSSDYQELKEKFDMYVKEMGDLLDQKHSENYKVNMMLDQYQFKLEKLNPDCSKRLILVCAPSNVAVDHLVVKINSTGLKVIRLYSKSKEEIVSDISHLSYHNIFLEKLNEPQNEELKVLYTKRKAGEIDKASKGKCIKLEMILRDKILKDYEVLCCTCIGTMDQRLAGLLFEKVVIDEACQAQEPESLLPLLVKPDQIILIGDHFQLGPIIKCKEAEKAGLENSLFRRLIDLGFEPYMLSFQYRMHPSIAAFPSYTFYNDRLENGITASDRVDTRSGFPWPLKAPTFFYHIDSQEEHSSTGKSFVNRAEAQAVLEIIEKLGNSSEIGIITFYDAQRVTISKYTKELEERGYNLEIASVDSFQGREKDYIILSCVRSNQHSGVGFLGNYRRLNVAITRAKYGLIICGNALTLSRSPVWNRLLDFYQHNGLVLTGQLDLLLPYHLVLRPLDFDKFDVKFAYGEYVEKLENEQ